MKRSHGYLLGLAPAAVGLMRYGWSDWPLALVFVGMSALACLAMWFADCEFQRRQREMDEIERRIRDETRTR